MSAAYPHVGPVGPDTLITVKVLIDGQTRRFKLALRDLGAHVLPQKLRFLLDIPVEHEVTFDRFSDSAGTYITLDSTNPAVYKQLYRAAKAKLKLRLRVNVIAPVKSEEMMAVEKEEKLMPEQNKPAPRNSYLETVLSQPSTSTDHVPSFKSFQAAAPPHPQSLEAHRTAVQLPLRYQMSTATNNKAHQLSRPTLPNLTDFCSGTFSIDCNNCGQSVPNEHYHCGVCEGGDFDLCQSCIDNGFSCNGDDHWLIKRTIKNGRVFPSITETLPPKRKLERKEAPAPIPVPDFIDEEQRTCNGCILQLPASSFVTCEMCPDFDLCFVCLENLEHGHHPAHTFAPVDATSSAVSPYVKKLCQQGRGLLHEAVCDGCEAQIFGVRHKCLSCPDFDYCGTCFLSASEIHPGHRFAPIYDQLKTISYKKECHRGVYCDGPICSTRSRKSYIRGDRYKCAVCHDTDFCANCEALPANPHNKSHPLIKIKTPIRHVSITTVNELDNGSPATTLGDRPQAKNAATETTRSTSANAATQVQTVAETKPVEMAPPESKSINNHSMLDAKFESESTPDGSSFGPSRLISQSWTLRNNGPVAWPAGCAVYYIGGDDMRKLDDKHPSSTSEMAKASRSNVLEQALEPGNNATFSVMLKSPGREGRAISYWRLKTPEGLAFGHKLWVDVTVVNKPVEAPTTVPVEAPVEKSEDESKEAVLSEKSEDSSTMIFPKLEKESPASSMENINKETEAPTAPSVVSEDQDLLDDLESMALEDDSTEDGFMTDEEYDILDAEDEDYLMEAQQAVNQK